MALSPRQRAIIANKQKAKAAHQGGQSQDFSSQKTSVQWDQKHAGFFHVEVYSKKASSAPKAKNATARTIHAVLAEVGRVEEYSRHVDAQKTEQNPPQLVFQNLAGFEGETAADFAQSLEQYIDRRLDQGEKQFRRKGKIIRTAIDPTQSALVAGVISLPESCASRYDEWLKKSIQFLQQEYPDGQLKGVIVHKDEANPHLHFYAVSNRRDVDAKLLHQAHAAQKQARAKGERPTIAFKQAMRDVQDRFYEAVSAPIGMKRKADVPHQRMKRNEYFAAKRERELAAAQELSFLEDIEAGERERAALKEENRALQGEIASRFAVFGPSEKSLEQSRQAAHDAGFQRARQKSAEEMRAVQEAHHEELAAVQVRHKTDLRAVAERFRADIEGMKAERDKAEERTWQVREQAEEQIGQVQQQARKQIWKVQKQAQQVQQQNEELRGGLSHKTAVALAKAGRRMWAFFGELGPQSIQAQTVFINGPQEGEGLLRWGYRLGQAMKKLVYERAVQQRQQQEQQRRQQQEQQRREQQPSRPVQPARPARPSRGSSGPSM